MTDRDIRYALSEVTYYYTIRPHLSGHRKYNCVGHTSCPHTGCRFTVIAKHSLTVSRNTCIQAYNCSLEEPGDLLTACYLSRPDKYPRRVARNKQLLSSTTTCLDGKPKGGHAVLSYFTIDVRTDDAIWHNVYGIESSWRRIVNFSYNALMYKRRQEAKHYPWANS
jgi:hypothetical protein